MSSVSREQRTEWPEGNVTRVPHWVYQDEEVYRTELRRLFEGSVWNFACLEIEIPNPGDYRTTTIGEMPIIVSRGRDGAVHAFENRCAHRGALIALDDGGNTDKTFKCVYHCWTYDLEGNLQGVPFERGSHGKGGMPVSFCKTDHGPRKLRTTTISGLVFVTLSATTPPMDAYLGDIVGSRLGRVLRKPVEVLGRFVQTLPNNWKLYIENVKDTYHAGLLHSFFRATNLTPPDGGVHVSPDGGHHASYTKTAPKTPPGPDDAPAKAAAPSTTAVRLEDTSMLEGVDEFGDGIRLQILTVFPTFVLQQIQNSIAVRQIIPKGPDKTDLVWTFLGFADDDEAMRTRRLKQMNLVGPAGFVSMEDGCVGGFVQRGIATAARHDSLINMGGEGAESQDTRATEVAVRGFWLAYRRQMGL
jgi:phenylpropionate dioxygenase-like ring-hydroxylating dioxygenase large terminal subunit